MKFRFISLALLGTILASKVDAQIAYAAAVNVGTTDLYKVDLATGGTTYLGDTGVDLLNSLSMSPSGRLYGANGIGDFFKLDPLTGAGTYLGDTGLLDLEGMDHVGDALYVIDTASPPSLFQVDESSGAPTHVSTAGSPIGYTRAMAYHPGQNLFYVVGDNAGTESLYTVSLSGIVTTVGFLGNNSQLLAADFDDSTGILWAMDTAGYVGKIDTTTGFFTITADTGIGGWSDMTIANPVPEPFTLMLVAGGLASAALRRRRR